MRMPLISVVLLLTLVTPARSETRIFSGEDLNTGSQQGDEPRLSIHPNADAARAAFLSALESYSVADFENFEVGNCGSAVLDFGSHGLASLVGIGCVKSVPDGSLLGAYPLSGNRFWFSALDVGQTVNPFTITFEAPQTALGFYATDIADWACEVRLTFDGTSTLTVPSTLGCPSGGVLFFGVVRTESPFTTVSFEPTRSGDGAGYDDIIVGRAIHVVSIEARTWGQIKELWRD